MTGQSSYKVMIKCEEKTGRNKLHRDLIDHGGEMRDGR
jgi:hypothetical protein